MGKRLMLLAVSVLAFSALAAGEPITDKSTGKTVNYTGTSGTTVLRSSFGNIECTSDVSHGTFQNGSSTGTVEMTLTGCGGPFGDECENRGVGTNEVTTGESLTDLVYIKGFVKTVGVLMTPPASGVLAKFTCHSFLPVTMELKGNGIIGHLDSPKCGEAKATFNLTFTGLGATQTYCEIEGSSMVYSLTSNGNPASEEYTENGTISNGATSTLTCL